MPEFLLGVLLLALVVVWLVWVAPHTPKAERWTREDQRAYEEYVDRGRADA